MTPCPSPVRATPISPAARVLVTVWLVGAMASLPLESTSSLATGVGVAAISVACLRPKYLRQLLLPSLLGLTAVVLPWLFTGKLELAARLGTRALAALGVALGTSSLHRASELPSALRSLGAPAPLAAVVATMLAQVEVAANEGRRLVLARQLRGAVAPAARAEVLSAWFVRTARRAERIDLARRLRGYDPGLAVRSATLQGRDVPWLLVAVAIGLFPHALGRLF